MGIYYNNEGDEGEEDEREGEEDTDTEEYDTDRDKKDKANVAAAKKKFGKMRHPSLYRMATPPPSKSSPPPSPPPPHNYNHRLLLPCVLGKLVVCNN